MDLNKYAVLNACNPIYLERESDEYVDYRGGPLTYFEGNKMVRKAISWHSIPAAFETEFFVFNKPGWQGVLKYDHILVMIKDDLPAVVPLIQKLKTMNKIVGLAFHENGNYFSMKAQDLNWLANLKHLVDMTHYFWNLNICLKDFFETLFKVPVFSCWHGLPYFWKHDFTVKPEDRKGIMIGTRTLTQSLKRNTLYSIGIAASVAKELGTFATYFSEDGIEPKQLQNLFEELNIGVNVIKGPTSYEEWLKIIATHKVLFHTDASETLGQVVGDAALVGVPSVGSMTTNNVLLDTECTIEVARDNLIKMYGRPFCDMSVFKDLTSLDGLRKQHVDNLFPNINK